jgi:hypothetical protein
VVAANCPSKPDIPFTTVQKLFTGEKDMVLQAGQSMSYEFTTKIFPGGSANVVMVPHFARGSTVPSEMNTMTISRCPGDFNIVKLGRACYGAGAESAIRAIVGKTARGICTLDPGTQYYLNITPVNPITLRSSCRGRCGVRVSVH